MVEFWSKFNFIVSNLVKVLSLGVLVVDLEYVIHNFISVDWVETLLNFISPIEFGRRFALPLIV